MVQQQTYYRLHNTCGLVDRTQREFILSISQLGYTPLITAAWMGQCDVVIELLENRADIDAQNNVSHSPCDVVSTESVCE